MIGAGGDLVIEIGAEGEALVLAAALDLHLHGDEGRILDPDQRPLGRGYKIVMSVGLTPQHRGEKLDQRLPPDRTILVIPGAVAADLEANIPAILRDAACGRARLSSGLAEDFHYILFISSFHLEPFSPTF